MSGPAARIRGSLVEWSAEMTKRLSYTKQASFIAIGNRYGYRYTMYTCVVVLFDAIFMS